MKGIKNLEFWCFVLLFINLATVAADFYFRRSTVALLPLPPGQSVAGPPGIALAGSPPPSAACHLVRYASINCGYCAPKFSQPWNDVERTLTQKGCDSIIVSPYSGDFPVANNKIPERRLAGVSTQFIRSTSFNSTPITLLVDRNWRIVWSHVGVVEQGDSQQALQAGYMLTR
jgi:hypothetical protein